MPIYIMISTLTDEGRKTIKKHPERIEEVNREISLGPCPRCRLLLRHTMLEFYLEDLLVQCYTMARPMNGTISCHNAAALKLWSWT